MIVQTLTSDLPVVWNVEGSVNMMPDDSNMSTNSNTWNTQKSEISINSSSSNDTEKSLYVRKMLKKLSLFKFSIVSNLASSFIPTAISGQLHSTMTLNTSTARTLVGNQLAGRYKSSSNMTQHVITIASSVTRVRWRPPALDFSNDVEGNVDRHDSMFAVATARLTSAGGSGVISLWSTHRPFMPLSVVEGHEEGAVADFVWMETPLPEDKNDGDRSQSRRLDPQQQKVDPRKLRKNGGSQNSDETILIRSGGRGDVDSILFDNHVKKNDNKYAGGAIWQHILSVGRDGKCILQSFVRGMFICLHRSISDLTNSCS